MQFLVSLLTSKILGQTVLSEIPKPHAAALAIRIPQFRDPAPEYAYLTGPAKGRLLAARRDVKKVAAMVAGLYLAEARGGPQRDPEA